MNLQQFVTETLGQIVRGVGDAKKNNQEQIAPEIAVGEAAPKGQLSTLSWKAVFPVEFDVAVSASQTSEKGGGGGVTVLSVFSLEGGGKTAAENSTVSRIKFSVPIAY